MKFPNLPKPELSTVKDVSSIIQAVVTVIAIAAAGYWFHQTREDLPRLKIGHEVIHHRLNDDLTWIHLRVKLQNIGNVKIDIKDSTLRAHQIVPLSSTIKKRIEQGKHIISRKYFRVLFPVIGNTYKPNINILIEPGETHFAHFEFLVPSDTKVVRIYTYFENQYIEKKGWKYVTIHEL